MQIHIFFSGLLLKIWKEETKQETFYGWTSGLF